MMPKPKGKKPGLAIAIGIGKPKPKPMGGDDLSEPDDLDAPEASPEGLGGGDESSEHDSGEGLEGSLGDVMEGIEAAGAEVGLDSSASKQFASSIFRALADACDDGSGGGGESPEMDAGAEGGDSGGYR